MSKRKFSTDLTDLIPVGTKPETKTPEPTKDSQAISEPEPGTAPTTETIQNSITPSLTETFQPKEPTSDIQVEMPARKTRPFVSRGIVPKSTQTFYIPNDTIDRLCKSAMNKNARSLSEYVTFILEKYLREEQGS